MDQRVNPDGPSLHVSLGGEVGFSETVEEEWQVRDCRRVSCEVKLEPSFQPVVVHFMIERKKVAISLFRIKSDQFWCLPQRNGVQMKLSKDLKLSWSQG